MSTPARKRISPPLRVYLIDAHPVIRLGLRSFFDTQPSVSVVGDASTLLTALPALRLCKPDVVITDTFPLSKTLLRGQDPLRILYTFETLEASSLAKLTQSLTQGDAGFVIKSLPLEGFIQAVHRVASGRKYRDPAFMRLLAARRRQHAHARHRKPASTREPKRRINIRKSAQVG
jgi:DNA-binding NarL/FixJ family response regulator